MELARLLIINTIITFFHVSSAEINFLTDTISLTLSNIAESEVPPILQLRQWRLRNGTYLKQVHTVSTELLSRRVFLAKKSV